MELTASKIAAWTIARCGTAAAAWPPSGGMALLDPVSTLVAIASHCVTGSSARASAGSASSARIMSTQTRARRGFILPPSVRGLWASLPPSMAIDRSRTTIHRPRGSSQDVARLCNPRAVSRPDYYGNPAGLTSDIDVVRGIYAAFSARDLDAAIALLSDDCILHLRGTQDMIGRSEPYRGHAGMREYYADVERTWEDLRLFADDYRAISGAVVVMGHVEGRAGGEPVRRGAIWTWKV